MSCLNQVNSITGIAAILQKNFTFLQRFQKNSSVA